MASNVHSSRISLYLSQLWYSSRLFDSGYFADLTIRCDSGDILCHNAIVYSGSKYFATAMQADMKVTWSCLETFQTLTSRQERATGIIELQEEPKEVMRALLRYLYTSTVDGICQCGRAFGPWTLKASVLYALADRFDVQELKTAVVNALGSHLERRDF